MASTADNSGKWALAMMGIAGLAFLFIWFKNNQKKGFVLPELPIKPANPAAKTVNDRITEGYLNEMSQLNDAEIKKYAEQLDKANDLAKQFLNKIGDSPEITSILKTINALGEYDFTAVVRSWKNLRSINSIHNKEIQQAMLKGESSDERQNFALRLIKLDLM